MFDTFQAAATAPRQTLRRRLIAAGLTALLVAGASSATWAQHGPGGPDAMMGDPAQIGRMAEHLLKGLDVSEVQRAQVRQIAQAAATDVKPQQDARRALREKSLQLMAAPMASVPDEQALTTTSAGPSAPSRAATASAKLPCK